jgi:hypothetical protein
MRILLAAMVLTALAFGAMRLIDHRESPNLQAIRYRSDPSIDLSAQRRARPTEPFTPAEGRP